MIKQTSTGLFRKAVTNKCLHNTFHSLCRTKFISLCFDISRQYVQIHVSVLPTGGIHPWQISHVQESN